MRPVRAWAETTYKGESKSRTISKIRLAPDGLFNANLEANLASFDRLYLADTTPRVIGSDRAAVTAVALVEAHRVGAELVALRAEPCALVEMHGLQDVNPELAGWAMLVDVIRTSVDYDPSWRVGLIGDTELGQLDAFNERLSPVAGDVFLPHNFRIHYAGDHTSDGVLNRAVRLCDRLSRFAVTHMPTQVGTTHMRASLSGVPCTWWRLWTRTSASNLRRTVFETADPIRRLTSLFVDAVPIVTSSRGHRGRGARLADTPGSGRKR